MRILYLACLMVPLLISAAYAGECEIRPSDLDYFAQFRLGQRLRILPKGVKKEPNCAVYRKYHTFDCGFADAYGNSYIASGHEIVKVERVPASSAMRLPSPLRFGMTMEEASSALSALDPKVVWTTDHGDKTDTLSSGECLKDKHGITYALTLDFDHGDGLSKVSAAFETSED